MQKGQDALIFVALGVPESSSHGDQPAVENVCERRLDYDASSLHKRIRHVGAMTAAKIEIRAFRSL
ncbi:hypothetical protein [Haematobacter genomosp. 1]|uniref:Uncharacterized protein n=1 Tax=Haematobacter genomosp. 1 TaxID=366618 RepID=A0A212AAC4_9RHOB|nr:hypothetical protein [Haematobacter genomosp. 1]OWJ77125.1 hypothetical protein CDV49_11910 [Haematobacter genomosp. 1]